MRYQEPDSKELGVWEVGEPPKEIIYAPASGTLYWFIEFKKEDIAWVDVGMTICAIIRHDAYDTEEPWKIVRSRARGYLHAPKGYGKDGIEVQQGDKIAEIDVVRGIII